MSSPVRKLLLTVDYEIFGNGSGDVREHIIAPTERMARICEKIGAPLTIFFEVEEYLAFQRERGRLSSRLGYDPAEEIRTQIIDLARRGHDMQLHLHPDWAGARLGDDGWILRPECKTVDSLFQTREETSDYIAERKAVIDRLLEQAGVSQRVTAYRAGGFCAQPGDKLLWALARNGFVLDSSLVKGMTRRDRHVAYDFRGAPKGKRHWRIRDDVAREEASGPLFEVPIHSRMGRRIQQLTLKRLLAKFSRHVPKNKQREMLEQLNVGRSPASIARFLLQPFPIKLDFHNMSAGQMVRWIRSAAPAPEGEIDALVLIGHSKEHRTDADLDGLVAAVGRDPRMRIVSMDELSRDLRQLQSAAPASAQPKQEPALRA